VVSGFGLKIHYLGGFEMRNAVVLMTMAGIASAAGAQTASLSIVASHATWDSTVTSTITLSVYASADFGTHIVGGGFSLSAVGGESVIGMDAAAASWGALGENDRGYAGDGNYTGLVFGQLVFPPLFPPNAASDFTGGEVFVASVVVELSQVQFGGVEWTLGADPLGGGVVLQVFDAADNSTTDVTVANFGSAAIFVVPSPSVLAVLGLGGLVAGRRRR